MFPPDTHLGTYKENEQTKDCTIILNLYLNNEENFPPTESREIRKGLYPKRKQH